VFSEGRVEIVASPEAVWDLIADIGGWPRWNPDVKEVSVQGEVAEGTVFRWKAGPGTITSTLRLVDRPRALGWTGRTFGIDAITYGGSTGGVKQPSPAWRSRSMD
jgi:carbon monoxide dehydrogenase subunit G